VPDEQPDASRRTAPAKATVRPSWWPGWIWSVPIAAVAICVWLLVRHLSQGGTDVVITFDDAHGVKPNDTGVEYRGTKVGEVKAVALTKARDAVHVTANIDDDAAELLNAGTIFWLRGAEPSISDLSSLGAVLSGPTIVLEPGGGAPTREFHGLGRKPAVPHDHGPAVRFRVPFDGAVGDVSEGDAVKLRGFPVGEVEEIGFHYDTQTGAIATPVTLALYPRLFHVEADGKPADADDFRATVGRLVGDGLRARLDREPPLVGSETVSLQMTPGAPAASLDVVDGLPQIPTAPGGGLESVVASVSDLPIRQIADNVLDATKHLDALVSSGQLKDSVAQLDAALGEVRRMVANVAPKVDDAVRSMREAAAHLRQTARAADRTLGAPAQSGVADTLREVKDAARAVRSLADYLDRHPEALISGKGRD